MKNFLKLIFNRKKKEEEEKELTKVSDLKVYDDVYVIIDSKVYKGWVMKKTSRLVQVYIWDVNLEFIISIINKTDQRVILFGKNNYLVLNKEDLCDYL